MELLLALIYTCIIEAAVTFVIIMIRRAVRMRVAGENRPKNDLIMIYYNLLCNMLTNPLLNLSLYGASRLGAGHGVIMIMIAIGEICVVFSECGLYRLMSQESRGFCFMLSLITNAVSYLTGVLIQ